jgi:phenylalanyl-tRNA synthetase beta chain
VSGKSYEHPRRAAEALHGETVVGRLFEFHPRLVESGRAAALDLDLAVMERLQPPTPRYEALRRFPSSAFDLSVIAPARALIGDVESELSRHGGADLLSIAFLRPFILDDGRRSLSYRLTVGAPERTLTLEEVNAIRGRVIEGMRQAGFELRV